MSYIDYLYWLSPLFAFLYFPFGIFKPYPIKRITENLHIPLWMGKLLFILWMFLSAVLLILIVNSLESVKSNYRFHYDYQHHYYTLAGIFVVLFLLLIARLWLERQETPKAGRAPLSKGLLDFFLNIVIAFTCYTATFKLDRHYVVAGFILACVSFIRVLKFRLYDDIKRYRLYGNESQRYQVPGDPSHSLFRGLFDHIPRAYLYIAFSFTIFQLLLMSQPYNYKYDLETMGQMALEKTDAFTIAKPSENIFTDFFYFNVVTIATVGYGDVSPVSSLAKLSCSVEIFFSIMVLAAIFSLMIGRFQDVARNSTNKS